MTPERYQRLTALFDELCDLDEAARTPVLAKLATEDAELARTLTEMLRQDAASSATMDGGAELVRALAADALRASERASAGGVLGPGRVLGHYRILRTLGTGGMATVYEARHRQIGRRVAIKVLHARVARDPQVARRFLNEARAVNLIRHPGLVEIHEFDLLDEGTCYLVMEYLEGEALDRRLDRLGRCTVASATSIARQVALALAAAHEHGVVHRDLKPGNIMILPDPSAAPAAAPADDAGVERAKVLDFGIARLTVAFDEEADAPPLERTHSSVIMGTPSYMSPEQCVRTASVTDRSDVYSLGVVLFELLTGRRPFVSELLSEIMTMHVRTPPPPVGELAPDVPAPLGDFVARMLAKDPTARPSMVEVAEALRDVHAMAPLPAPGGAGTTGRSGGGGLARIGRRSTWVALAVVVVASVGLVAWQPWAPGRGMVLIPAATFTLGSEPDEILAAGEYCEMNPKKEDCGLKFFEREQPPHEVRLSPYRLDITEVTNSDIADWLNRTPGLRTVLDEETKERWVFLGEDRLVNLYPSYPVYGLELVDGRYRAAPSAEELPAAQVTWLGAHRYCQSRGARLPTEAEWEYAAKSGPGSRFPWGREAPRCDGVVFGRQPGQDCAGYPLGPASVGTMKMDVSPFGVRDLAGNVAEWVEDPFLDRYAACTPPCLDPVAPLTAPVDGSPVRRVIRGGDWNQIGPNCRSAGRSRWRQDEGLKNVGFRCAASAK